jgi:phage terminase large subunit-like protein
MTEHYRIFQKYIEDIHSNKVLSGTYTKKAVRRFQNDLKRSRDSDFLYIFKPELAEPVINFAECLIIPDMPTPDKHLRLLPWMLFVYYNLYGWVLKTDTSIRRFRSGYVELARKNSKTTSLLNPFILYDFLTTPAAESYLVSKDEKQSCKSFDELKQIIVQTPELAKIGLKPLTNCITYKSSRISYFSSDSGGIDAYKNSLSIIDEFHAYDTDKVLTAFKYGGRARKNCLTLIITSAGLDTSKPCYTENERAKKILNNVLSDEQYFTIIYSIDDTDDWKDESIYIKANPSLGVIIKPENLHSDLIDAINQPSHRQDFMSKTLGRWVFGTSAWIPADKLSVNDNVIVKPDDLLKHRCCGAWDLSEIHDWTALSFCFQINNKYTFIHHFYIPADTINEKYKHENISLTEWIEKGIVTVIPGSTIDYDFIFKDIQQACKRYDVTEICYDPWNGVELTKKIEDELPSLTLVPVPQNLKTLAPMTKTFEKMILDGKLIDNNPAVRWMYGNVCIKPDAEGNYRPLKAYKSSTGRIDGIITSLMSYSRLISGTADVKPFMTFDQILNSF